MLDKKSQMKIQLANRLGLIATISVTCALCSCRDEEAHTRISRLEADSSSTQEALRFLLDKKSEDSENEYTIVDITGNGFAAAKSNNGTFLISCKGAEPYLDGHKLALKIGNPYFMTYSGFTVKARFGRRPPDVPGSASADQKTEWRIRYEQWEKALKEIDVSSIDELAPGAWTNVELILSPSKPEEVGYLSLRIETDQVALHKAKD